jgi:hypothetical protein
MLAMKAVQPTSLSHSTFHQIRIMQMHSWNSFLLQPFSTISNVLFMTLELMVYVTLTLMFESHADCCLSLFLFVFVCSLTSTEEEVRSWAPVCHPVSPTWLFLV